MEAAYREKIDAPMNDVRCFVRFDCATKPMDTPLHWHSLTELLLVDEGSYRQQIGEHVFEAVQGDIILIGEGQIHATVSLSRRKGAVTVIQFYADKAAAPFVYSGRVRRTDPSWNKLASLISTIKSEYEVKTPASCCRVKSCLYQIQAEFLENEPPQIYCSQIPPDLEFITRVSAYISNHYSDALTVTKAAESFHLSTSHFARLFKQNFGVPFMRYINIFRLQMSNKILKETGSVSETAYLCGFPNYSVFKRQYKSYYNITPKQHLQNLNKKEKCQYDT